MYKTIKIPELAFKNAEELKKEMSMDEGIKGIRKVSLSEVVSYALKELSERREKRKHLMSLAGSWSDIDTEAMTKEIYSSRRNSIRELDF